MRSIVNLLTSLDGRIGRAQFWFGVLAIVVFTVVMSVILMQLGLGETTTMTGTYQVNGGDAASFTKTSFTLNKWATFVLMLIAAFPSVVIGIKRRRDRNFAGWDVVVFLALWQILSLFQALGLFGDGLFAASFILTVWAVILFILLGCLRGTPGDNRYGPDPLAGAGSPVPTT